MKVSVGNAIQFIDKSHALLVFPLNNAPQPRSLWHCYYPRSEMRWEWDEHGDNRVGLLWHLRTELSSSREVVYTKWYQGRATFFSNETFTALLHFIPSEVHKLNLSSDAKSIYKCLLEDSPQPTKRLRLETGFDGKSREGAYTKALNELWRNLLIVGFGESEEGGFPSLMMGATRLLFEELWDTSRTLSREVATARIETLLVSQPKFKKTVVSLLQRAGTPDVIK